MRRAMVAVVLLVAAPARAEDAVTTSPPLAPFQRGASVEGDVGVYAPTGRIKNLVAPGPLMRVSLGWDFKKWVGIFGSVDAAFLSTGRAPPPPGERAFILWGFGGGARLSLGLGARVRIPFKLEIGMHKTADDGVLATYGYVNAKDLNVSYGVTTGLEWRAASRHYALLFEGGVRNDSCLDFPGKSQAPLAIVFTLGLHYTL